MSNSTVRHEEQSDAEMRALERRVREHHARVEAEVASGRRDPRSLLVMAQALQGATPEFPAKPYPTSAAAWRT